MPREFSRGRRVADLIQQQLARLIQLEIKDPRVGMVTINDVKVSRDLAFADVYFTMMGDTEPQAAEEALGNASGFLRSQLAKSLTTRSTPRLRFHYDATIEEGARISRAIHDAIRDDEARSKGREEDGDES